MCLNVERLAGIQYGGESMSQYELVMQDLRVKRILLSTFGLFMLVLTVLILWGMIEPWIEGGAYELERVAKIAQTVVLLLIGALLLWISRVLLRRAAQTQKLAERVQRGEVDRGRFQVVDSIIGFKQSRTGDRVGKVYTLYVQHIETGRQITFRIWRKVDFDKIIWDAIYEVEYIEEYPYVLRLERIV